MNVGMVGYGMIAEHHVRALQGVEGVQFHWLVGRRAEPTQEAAAHWKFTPHTLHLEEALADDALEAIVITSPNALHAPQATAALKAGKHVLLELPMALTLAESEQLATLAKECGRVLMICHTMRTFSSFAHIRHLVDEGQFHLRQFMGQLFLSRRTNRTVNGDPRSWTDNILWHHAAHFVDLALWLGNCDRVERVSYHNGPDYNEQGTMDMSLTMTLPSGAIANVSNSYFAPGLRQQLTIVGDETTYIWHDGTLYDFDGKEVMPNTSIVDLAVQDREFIAAIREQRVPLISAEAILPTMRVLSEAQAIADGKVGG